MTILRSIPLLALAALLALGPAASGQTALTTTTFAGAVGAGDDYVDVASATGITAASIRTNTILYAGREALRVTSVSGTRIGVRRGVDTRPQAHLSGATVWIGPPQAFASAAPVDGAPCTVAEQGYKPLIVPSTGQFADCDGTRWLILDNPAGLPFGTAGTGVTAYEYGSGRNRVTKLTLDGIAVGSVTNADVAKGAIVYTFPTSNIIIHGAKLVTTLDLDTNCASDDPDVGLGTTIASGSVAVLGGTGAFEDILTGQTSVNGVVTAAAVNQGTAVDAATAAKVHLNVADGWAGSCDIAVTSGTAIFEWSRID
jgi:hypothetical protein